MFFFRKAKQLVKLEDTLNFLRERLVLLNKNKKESHYTLHYYAFIFKVGVLDRIDKYNYNPDTPIDLYIMGIKFERTIRTYVKEISDELVSYAEFHSIEDDLFETITGNSNQFLNLKSKYINNKASLLPSNYKEINNLIT